MFEIFHTVFKYKEKESPDIMGHYPARVHIDAMPERRYLWTSRALVILSAMSVSLNMILGSSLYILLPQRSASPKLFQINRYFSVLEQVLPAEMNFPVSDLITEKHISEYIMLRYIITNDYDELRERWSPGSRIYWFSSSKVFGEFLRNDVELNIAQFKQSSLMRDVNIEWIRPLALKVWQVQFQTLDYFPDVDKPTVNIWRATMRINYVDIVFPRKEDAIINPFGFVVENFSLAYLGTPELSDHYLKTVKEITEQYYNDSP